MVITSILLSELLLYSIEKLLSMYIRTICSEMTASASFINDSLPFEKRIGLHFTERVLKYDAHIYYDEANLKEELNIE